MIASFKKITFLFLVVLFGNSTLLKAQQYPEVPSEIPFAGINVKLDNSAKSVILSDVKVLMINQKYWEEKLERALLYFPIIESIFIKEEIPIDFKYLAAQESSLIPDAVSSSNAVGFWQFKAETARDYGMRVDNLVDERKNISSSTRGAAAYLNRSNEYYNNWVSALYSYYLGFSGIKTKIPTNWNGANEVTLTSKSDRYVLRFFAYKIAFDAGLENYQPKNPITLVESAPTKSKRLDDIANELKISYVDLRSYNKWFEGEYVPSDKEYYVTIPAASARVAAVKQSLPTIKEEIPLLPEKEISSTGYPKLKKSSVQPKGNNPHTLYEINGIPGILARAGDYANSLAKAGKVSVGKFRKSNDMETHMEVVPGEVYYLASKNKRATTPYHVVQKGETLHSISQMYGIRQKHLMKYNRINNKSYRPEVGRQMWLTQRRPARVPVRIIEEEVRPETKELPNVETETTVVETSKPTVHTIPTPSSNNDIPKTSADRKKYTPKIADETAKPAETTVVTKATPAPKTTEPEEKVLTKPSTSKSNSRVIIVSDDDIRPTNSTSTTTARPREEDTRPTYSPSTTRPAPAEQPTAVYKPSTSTNESKPATAAPKVTNITKSNLSHTVEKGETYYSISKKYDLTITELLDLNGLAISDNLKVGQNLKVSGNTSNSNTKPATTAKPSSTGAYTTHTVAKGETLFSISKRYNTTVEEVKTLNKLPNNNVQLGQKLKVPNN